MAYPLSPEIQDRIYVLMHNAFRDLPFYEKVIEVKMRKIIADANHVRMDQSVHKRLTDRYYDVGELNKTDTGRSILSQIHVAVRACYVLILAHQPSRQELLWPDVATLVKNYPELGDLDDTDELQFLLQFRNMLRLALVVVPARLNKKLLINIAARLEGSGREYITGGGQKPCVTRRVQIYEQEGNIRAETREQPRLRKDPASLAEGGMTENITGKKRPQLNTSLKRLKMIRIASEEARNFNRTPFVSTLSLADLTNSSNSPTGTDLLSLSRFPSNMSYSSQHSSSGIGGVASISNITPFTDQSGSMTTSSVISFTGHNPYYNNSSSNTSSSACSRMSSFGVPLSTAPVYRSDGSVTTIESGVSQYTVPSNVQPQGFGFTAVDNKMATEDSVAVFDELMGYSTGSLNASTIIKQPTQPTPQYPFGVWASSSVLSGEGKSGQLATTISLPSAPPTLERFCTEDVDLSDLFDFPPGLLSRQQSEWVTSYLQQQQTQQIKRHLASLDVARASSISSSFGSESLTSESTFGNKDVDDISSSPEPSSIRAVNPSGDSDFFPARPPALGTTSREVSIGGMIGLSEFFAKTDESTSIALPMLRAVSWDIGTPGFQHDLADLFSPTKTMSCVPMMAANVKGEQLSVE